MKRFFTLLLTLFLFTLLCSFAAAQETILMGDLDKDNKLSASDARTILRTSVKLETLGEYDLFLADVDFDSNVSASDARLVLRGSVLLEARSKFEHTHESDGAGTRHNGGCTEDSYTLHTCKTCTLEYKTNVTAATGHAWSEWTPGEMMQHSRQCANCEETESDVCRGASTTVDPTCTTDGYLEFKCSVCPRTEQMSTNQKAPGHSYNETVIAATCTEEGYTQYKCKRCPDTYVSEEKTPALGHNIKQLSVEVSCTTDGYTLKYCTRCDHSEEVEPVKAEGHKFNAWSDKQGVYTRKCSVCSEEETTLDWFNQTVNPLKAAGQNTRTITCISYNESKNTSSNEKFDYDFGLDLALKAMMYEMLKESLNTSETTYSVPRYNRVLTHGIFPAMSKDYVSALDDADIKSITRTTGQKVNVLSDINATFTAKNDETYDISALKNKVINNAVKVSMEIVPAKAVKTGTKNGKNVYAYYNGDTKVSEDTELALERIYGLRIQGLCDEFPTTETQKDKETGATTMSMTVDCTQLVAKAVIDWYFDAANDKPIACQYTITNILSQTSSMTCTDPLELSGSFDLQTEIVYHYIFLFSDYYPVD